ncbi:MAG TPA: cytochrome c3 family protein [Pyrinomonadaceae bacterium]|nr:cytochrome c3 family protein [Pyrinomonadaceae bacterium]HMP64650.1 cytochrome c3 family protein [Pyrinomonadaceae bacterium]
MRGQRTIVRKNVLPATRELKLAALICTVLATSFYFVACGSQPPADDHNISAMQTPEPESTQIKFDFPDANYSKFNHENEQHARLPCLVCHVREDNSPHMKFAGHIPCASCHVEHFEDPQGQICTICHSEPVSGTMRSFPTLSSFNAKFDHARHAPHTNCADCHRQARSGATFSVPTRANSHATCFQCHSPNAEFEGRDISSCSTCHESGSPGPRGGGVRALPANFSHSVHGRNQRLSCNSCHTARPGAPRGRQVTAPAAIMHLGTRRGQNCATCHNGKRAFGDEDFASCSRCHQSSSFKF